MNRPPKEYPDAPGFKASGPSEQAATAISSTAKTLRDQVLKTIAEAPAGLSADAVADRLGRSVLPQSLEAQLWEKVQKAYAASRSYRAGDDPDYAKALAEYQFLVFGPPRTNVIPFPSGVRR
jgi:hypothetical protein